MVYYSIRSFIGLVGVDMLSGVGISSLSNCALSFMFMRSFVENFEFLSVSGVCAYSSVRLA